MNVTERIAEARQKLNRLMLHGRSGLEFGTSLAQISDYTAEVIAAINDKHQADFEEFMVNVRDAEKAALEACAASGEAHARRAAELAVSHCLFIIREKRDSDESWDSAHDLVEAIDIDRIVRRVNA